MIQYEDTPMKQFTPKHLFSVFEAALLFILSTPIVMYYRIFPVEKTSYEVFFIYFMMNIFHILYSLFIKPEKIHYQAIKNFFTWSIVLIVFVGAMWTSIADRGKLAPGQFYQTHDIILQLEAAIQYITKGKNPYRETYFGTPMEQWHYAEEGKDAVNPALYHFVMPPWYVLSAYPFYFVSMRTLGYFDGRMPLFFATLGLLVMLFYWIKSRELARLSVILVALNPATIGYLIEGRSDFMVLFWFVLSLFLIDRKKTIWAAFALAAAIMTKQTVWFAFPVVVGYLWLGKRLPWKKILAFCFVAGSVSLFIALPFLLWDAKAFVDSVIFYLAGNSVHSYPISGYGLGALLIEFGVIRSIHSYYPFVVWQVVFGVPAFIASIWIMNKYKTISMIFILHACTLFVIWYTSRYFNNSHVAYISLLFLIGILKYCDEGVPSFV